MTSDAFSSNVTASPSRWSLRRLWPWRDRRVPRAVLALMLVTDAVFALMHLLEAYGGFETLAPFALDLDGGFPEVFGYLEMGWAAILLAVLARRLRDPLLLVLAGTCGIVVLDDWLRLHERTGSALTGDLGGLAVGGIRPEDIGEIAFVAVVGTLVVVVALAALRWATSDGRIIALGVGLAFAPALIAGVLIDLIHVEGAAHPLLKLAEDGVELVAMSFVLANVVGWLDLLTDPAAPAPDSD